MSDSQLTPEFVVAFSRTIAFEKLRVAYAAAEIPEIRACVATKMTPEMMRRWTNLITVGTTHPEMLADPPPPSWPPSPV